MKTLAEIIPTASKPQEIQPSPSFSQTLTRDMAERRFSQLQALISQSFEIFNVYGKKPEAVKSIVQGFAHALDDQPVEEITKAFKDWMRQSSVMPAPADILKTILSKQAPAPKVYAEKPFMGEPKAAARAVQWARKLWPQFTDSDKAALAEHLAGMPPEQAKVYRQYLHQWCGAPKPEGV